MLSKRATGWTRIRGPTPHFKVPPYDTWDYVKIETSADRIQWLWFDGRLVIDDLKITRAKQDTTFHLTAFSCTPSSPIRGDSISCAVEWNPATIPASEIYFEWRFEGDSVHVFPEPGALPYSPPQPKDSVGTGIDAWSGPAVLGGRVSVNATWQGDSESASTSFSVAPRTGPQWGDLRVIYDAATVINTPLLGFSTLEFEGTVGRFGANVDSILGSDDWNFANTIRGEPVLKDVPRGPNTGLTYVAGVGDLRSTRVREILSYLNGTESPKFSYYRIPGRLLTNLEALVEMRAKPKGNPRQFANPTEFRDGVLAHEGYGRNGAKGHQAQIEFGAAFSCGRLPFILERLVADDPVAAQERVRDVKTEGWKSIAHGAWHQIVHSNYSNAPYYEIVPEVKAIDENYPYKTYEGDTPKPVNPDLARDENWKCGRL